MNSLLTTKYLTPREAAQAAGVSIRTIQRWIDTNKLAALTNPNRIPQHSLEKLLHSQMNDAMRKEVGLPDRKRFHLVTQ